MKRRGLIVLIIWSQMVCLHVHAHTYGVILAGGAGERLWPLSRQAYPKQFLSVDASYSLLEQSIQRLQGIIPSDNIWIVTAQEHTDAIAEQVKRQCGTILAEPTGRNTGPAVLYACLELYKKDPDAVIVFAPADPYIPERDYALFRSYITRAIEFAATNEAILLCGIKPNYPATGYGYIEYQTKSDQAPFFRVARFHEKPSVTIAQNYMHQPNMLWNIGMFVAKASVFIDEFQRIAPDLFQEVNRFCNDEASYTDIMPISVDCAVIEKSNRTWVLPVDFSWCDVGTVDVFLSIKEKVQGLPSSVVAVESHNNVVDVPDKLVALVGVDDLCVVETSDALLITRRSEVEKVHHVVSQLKQEHKTEYT